MKKIKSLVLLIVALFVMIAPSMAKADTAWCYRYIAWDSFDGPNQWEPWNGSYNGTIAISNGEAKMSFASSEPNGSFLIIDKLFDDDVTTSQDAWPGRGTAPRLPSHYDGLCGELKTCTVEAYVMSILSSQGADGDISLIDPSGYWMLETKHFRFSPDGAWHRIILPSLNCRDKMIVRIGITRTPTSRSMKVDNIGVYWLFG
jgi:hypothetical protein